MIGWLRRHAAESHNGTHLPETGTCALKPKNHVCWADSQQRSEQMACCLLAVRSRVCFSVQTPKMPIQMTDMSYVSRRWRLIGWPLFRKRNVRKCRNCPIRAFSKVIKTFSEAGVRVYQGFKAGKPPWRKIWAPPEKPIDEISKLFV